MSKFVLSVVASALALSIAVPASATVVNFDDLTGGGTVADGYGGINWNSNFSFYDSPQFPYTASSGNTRIYSNYGLHTGGEQDSLIFNFLSAVKFQGFFAAGAGIGSISYDLYNAGNLVASSISVVTNGSPQFVSNSYGGSIDEVRIQGVNGFSVFDDVTYSAGGVPEPASWALMIAGFGLVGAAARRRQSVRVTYA